MTTAVGEWSAVLRLMWREYRLTRSIWLAVFVLSVGLQHAWQWSVSLWPAAKTELPFEWWIALAMPLVFLLVVMGTSFSREHESGAFQHLEILPTKSHPIWVGKTVVAVAATLLMVLLLTLSNISMGAGTEAAVPKRWPSAQFMAGVWLAWMLIAAGAAGICSQWINRPLTAVFTAAAITAVVWEGTRREPPLIGLFLLGAGLLFVSGLHIHGWLGRNLVLRPARLIRIPRISLRKRRISRPKGERLVPPLIRFAWVNALGYAIAALGALGLLWCWGAGIELFQALAVFPPLLGATLFHRENSPTHRALLVNCGLSGRQCWWARQIIVGFLLAALLATFLVLDPPRPDAEFLREFRSGVVRYTILSYGTGQLASMLLASSLVSIVVSLGLAVLVAFWAMLTTALEVPLIIAVGIPSLGLLATSWVRANAWLLAQTSWRGWWPMMVALAVAATSSYGLFWLHRVTEIDPSIDSHLQQYVRSVQVQITRNTSDDARRILSDVGERVSQTSELGLFASDMSVGPGLRELQENPYDESPGDWVSCRATYLDRSWAWVEESGQLVTEEVIAALDAPSIWSLDQLVDDNADLWYLAHLERMLAAMGESQTAAGNLDDAMDRFQQALKLGRLLKRNRSPVNIEPDEATFNAIVAWAAHPNQTAERVEQMIGWLSDYPDPVAQRRDGLAAAYLAERAVVSELPESMDRLRYRSIDVGMLPWALVLPGERQRTLQAMDWQFSLIDGARPTVAAANWIKWGNTLWRRIGRVHRTTPLLSLLNIGPNWPVQIAPENWLTFDRAHMAARIRLVLLEFRLRHGALPDPVDGNRLPPEIIERVAPGSEQVTDPKTEQVVAYYRSFNDGDRRGSRFTIINEPTRQYVVDGLGEPAILLGDRLYPIPRF